MTRRGDSARIGFAGPTAFAFALCAFGTLAAAQPTIEDLALHPVVGQYERQEISFQIRGVAVRNPYNPSEIAVDAVFSAPSGRELKAPGFFHVAHDPFTNSPADGSDWRIRFTPAEVGTYSARIFLSLRGGEPRDLGTASFRCAPSSKAGFVRRKERLLVLESGGAFLPIGGNRCWSGTGSAAAYLADMRAQAEQGVNCVRVWLAPWWLPIEPKAGAYDPAACALLDAIVAAAEELDMRVIVCIEQHGNLQPEGIGVGQWPKNPYNAQNGGPCRRRLDFFTAPRARELFKNRLRHLVARWGCSPSVLAWELFNEVELVDVENEGYANNLTAIAAWHREMSAFLRARDPYSRLVMTSSDLDFQKALLKDGAVDLLTVHMYKDGELCPRLKEVLAGLRAETKAPILVEEFGPIRDGGDARRVMRGTFVAALGAMGGGAMPWLQDVETPAPLYERLAAARRFFNNVRWESEDFRPIEDRIVVELNLDYHAAGEKRESLPAPLHVLALQGRTEILLFAFSGPERGPDRPTQWVRFRFQDMPPGKYRVEAWDPALGRVLGRTSVEADAEGLLVEVSDCPPEIALKIEMPLDAGE